MDDNRSDDTLSGATILQFPAPQSPRPPEAGEAAGDGATEMAVIQATIINMLLQQMRRLQQVLPQIVDGLIRRPESGLIADYWAQAADGQDRLLSTVMDVLGKITLLPIDPDLYAATDRSVLRLRSLIAECRRPPEERAVLFGSGTHLRGRVLEEMAILERNLAALDAAARKATGLDEGTIR